MRRSTGIDLILAKRPYYEAPGLEIPGLSMPADKLSCLQPSSDSHMFFIGKTTVRYIPKISCNHLSQQALEGDMPLKSCSRSSCRHWSKSFVKICQDKLPVTSTMNTPCSPDTACINCDTGSRQKNSCSLTKGLFRRNQRRRQPKMLPCSGLLPYIWHLFLAQP